jgi:hypothetical protein
MKLVDTLIIKYGTGGDFIEDEIYVIRIDYSKCSQIISIEQGILHEDNEDFLKSIDGQMVSAIYKGKSRIEGMNIFLISPLQINRQIKLDQIL